MSYESNTITIIGNLTGDPELRFTSNGTPVATLTVAHDHKRGEQTETTFVRVNAWRDLAENVAQSLVEGDRAVVIGRLRIRSYEDRDGNTKWVTEIVADEVAPSLRWAQAKPEKVDRSRQPTPTAAAPDEVPEIDDVPF